MCYFKAPKRRSFFFFCFLTAIAVSCCFTASLFVFCFSELWELHERFRGDITKNTFGLLRVSGAMCVMFFSKYVAGLLLPIGSPPMSLHILFLNVRDVKTGTC